MHQNTEFFFTVEKKLNSDLQTYILSIIIWIKYSSKKTEENKITRNSWTWIFSAKVRWTVTFTQARYKMKSCLNTITRKRFDRYTNIKDQDAKDSYKLWKLALKWSDKDQNVPYLYLPSELQKLACVQYSPLRECQNEEVDLDLLLTAYLSSGARRGTRSVPSRPHKAHQVCGVPR